MIIVSSSYIVSVLLVAFVLVVSLVLGFALRTQGGRTRLLFNLAGILLIGIAGLEKIGWSFHPWTAGSPAQVWDDMLFRVLWLVGLGLILVSWSLAFYAAEPGKAALSRVNAAPLDRRVSTL